MSSADVPSLVWKFEKIAPKMGQIVGQLVKTNCTKVGFPEASTSLSLIRAPSSLINVTSGTAYWATERL